MDAVGASATSTKKAAGMSRGKQVLTEARIRPSENGGFTVEQQYRQDSKGEPSPYVEPKTFTFESFDTMVSHLAGALGGAPAPKPAESELPPAPAEAAPTPPDTGPLEESGLYSGVARG
jgi:hypothetical protein